ncbi:MAG: hypothetical protein JWP43_3217 [Ramlibacter sp.]|jgi:hypothetical protein|nr:hypothetical protein [Ramlibacter sp.]
MNVLQTIKTVAWSFIGIRKHSEFQADLGKVNPFHVIAVALLGVALFVGALVLLVRWVAG